MTLTPLDIENVKFRSQFSGYNRAEVDRLLALVSQEMENRLNQIEELGRKIGHLEQTLATYRESEELLKSSVVLAQRTSDEIIAAAHQQADAIRRRAESEGLAISRQMGELAAQREQFEYAFHGLLAGFLHRLEQGNPALAQRERMAGELASASETPAAAGAEATAPRMTTPPAAAAYGAASAAQLTVEPAHSAAAPSAPAAAASATATPPAAPPAMAADDFERALAAAEPAPRAAWPPAASTEAAVAGELAEVGPAAEPAAQFELADEGESEAAAEYTEAMAQGIEPMEPAEEPAVPPDIAPLEEEAAADAATPPETQEDPVAAATPPPLREFEEYELPPLEEAEADDDERPRDDRLPLD